MFSKIRNYILLYGAFLIYSCASVCSKYAAEALSDDAKIRVVIFLALEVLVLGLYAITWQQVLKHFSLVTAMASKGSVVIINLIWSVLLFSEVITIFNVVGAAVIILGIWMVSTDG